jgi:hypothetical protein
MGQVSEYLKLHPGIRAFIEVSIPVIGSMLAGPVGTIAGAMISYHLIRKNSQ